jgi:hypothetical protein
MAMDYGGYLRTAGGRAIMSSVDSGAPCGEGWREEACMVESNSSRNDIVG